MLVKLVGWGVIFSGIRWQTFKMRYLTTFLFLLTLLLFACNDGLYSTGNQTPHYCEKSLSFFDPSRIGYSYQDWDNYLFKEWVRNPRNLKTVHETIKKIGYKKFVSPRQLYSNPCLQWGYVKKPLNHIIDSLLITYPLDTIETTYYREFWQRRKVEQNDSMVFVVLKDLDSIFLQLYETIHYDPNWVNDTLERLVTMDKFTFEPSKSQAKKDFDYLVSLGMHQSAYNVLYERFQYADIDWNKDSLLSTLCIDTNKCCRTPWLIDNTK